MRILVIGNGAREHALLWKLSQSPLVSALYAAPGNAGMAEIATCLPPAGGHVDDAAAYADIAEREQIDLTIVGPENLLVAGLVDHFNERGLAAFGPTRMAARIEGSKIWAKDLMQRVGIPSAIWRSFDDQAPALQHAESLGWRCVVKADGLTAGKGTYVCTSEQQVRDALSVLLDDRRYGDGPVIVEELLVGQELSVFAITDGTTVLPFGAAQDHKRVHDKDEGVNTGGMGAYSPVDHMRVAEDFAVSFFQPIVAALAEDGTPYVGVLYAGAIITDEGPKILEFNCRLGDPEAEVLLCRLDSDLAEILRAAASGQLHIVAPTRWSAKEALCVVMATDTYPERLDIATPIYGLDKVAGRTDVCVFHAGTERVVSSGELITSGGRILAITGLGHGLEQARESAYRAVEEIHFEHQYYRHDIGAKALGTVRAATWNAQWRKPPDWETRATSVADALGVLARRVTDMPTRSAENLRVELEQLRQRLFELRLDLQPARLVDASNRTAVADLPVPAGVSGRTRLGQLEGEFDAMLERMDRPEARMSVMDALSTHPRDYGKLGGRTGLARLVPRRRG